MTRTVRLLGQFMNANEETVDIVCGAASASVPPSRQDVGAGGDVQYSVSPTAIVLWDVEPESLSKLRNGTWTHIEWSNLLGEPGHLLQIRQLIPEGTNLRVLV